MSDGDAKPADQTPWWRKGATGLAVAGLLVTLVFNALGVWQGAQHDEQARRTEQIGLLTQLNQKLTEAEAQVNATSGIKHRCDDQIPPQVLREVQPPLRATLTYYEYLAWLYNSGQLAATHSEAVFAARLIDGQDVADKFFGPTTFPELSAFARGRKASPC